MLLKGESDVPRQIKDLEVEFVSLVDKGANKKKFLIIKRWK